MAKKATVLTDLFTGIIPSDKNGFYYVATFANNTADVTHWKNGNIFKVASRLKTLKEVNEAINQNEKTNQ